MTRSWAAALLWTLAASRGGEVMADTFSAVDYLGAESPVDLSDRAALPVGGPPAGAIAPSSTSAGTAAARGSAATGFPTTPSATTRATSSGSVTTTPSGVPGVAGLPPIMPDPVVAGSVPDGPEAAGPSLLQRLIAMGGDVAKVAMELDKLGYFDSEPTQGPRDEAAFQEQRAQERALFGAGAPDFVNKETGEPGSLLMGREFAIADDLGITGGTGLSKADMLAAAEAEFGATGAESAGASFGDVAAGAGAFFNELRILNSKGPQDKKIFDTIGNLGQLAATLGGGGPLGGIAAGLVHEYISTPIIEALFGSFGPSKAWINFPKEVTQTLDLTEKANQNLALKFAQLDTPDELAKAIVDWKGEIGQRVGGFGDGMPLDIIPDVPGATGTKHEGGISANFNPETAGLRAMYQAALRGAPFEERVQAFHDAAINAMTDTQRIAADPSGALLTPQQQASWADSLVMQSRESHPEIAAAIEAGHISPVQAQGILDAIGGGPSSVVKPSADLLAQYVPQAQGSSVFDASGLEYWNSGNLNTGG